MSSTLFSPVSGIVGFALTAWLLTLGGIAAWRRQKATAISFLLISPGAGIGGWSLMRDSTVWRQESAELPIAAYYGLLGYVLLGLVLMLGSYVIDRFDSEQVDPSGARWMLPATGAAVLATSSLLLDVAMRHMATSWLGLLSIISGALAMSLVALTAIKAAQAWGNRRHRRTTE